MGLRALSIGIKVQMIDVKEDFCLRSFNTLNIKSSAKYFYEINSIKDLSLARKFILSKSLKYYILGGGSNIVLTKDIISALILKINLKGRALIRNSTGTFIEIAAGENWDDFIDWAVTKGMFCFSYMAGIPGTVGAAPVQNIGAYGSEVADFVEYVEVYDLSIDQILRVSYRDCRFGYRSSIFQCKRNWVIIGVLLRTQPRIRVASLASETPRFNSPLDTESETSSENELHNDIRQVRDAKLPCFIKHPNVGSFFKNPIIEDCVWGELRERFPGLRSFWVSDGWKLSAAELIESVGLKGRYFDGVGMSSKHSLVLENNSEASFEEVNFVVKKVQADVLSRFGISLEVEPNFWS